MFQNICPLFEEKRVLKKEMLENLRDYPRDMFDIQHLEYSDGILVGCRLEADGAGIVVQPGILRHKGVPYVLRAACRISCRADGRLVYLKVRFMDKAIGSGQEEYLSQVYADGEVPDSDNEMELGRFKLQPGARLRTEYTDFYDFATEYDTVGRIHVPYAAPGGISIWPSILQRYAAALAETGTQNPWDCAFCLNGLQAKEAMPYGEIRAYLNARLGQSEEYTNEQIYAALRSILQEAEGKKQRPGKRTERPQGMLML